MPRGDRRGDASTDLDPECDDAAAHRGALHGGSPTVAVLGSGPDRIYPAANAELADSIAARGALVSE
ncbi:MAG: DNA-processing protein DprA, partial [Phycisphaerales bacterium]